MEYDNYINHSVETFVEDFATSDDLVWRAPGFDPSLTHKDQRKRYGPFSLYTRDERITHIEAHNDRDCRCIIEYPANDLSALRVECRKCHDIGDTLWYKG